MALIVVVVDTASMEVVVTEHVIDKIQIRFDCRFLFLGMNLFFSFPEITRNKDEYKQQLQAGQLFLSAFLHWFDFILGLN